MEPEPRKTRLSTSAKMKNLANRFQYPLFRQSMQSKTGDGEEEAAVPEGEPLNPPQEEKIPKGKIVTQYFVSLGVCLGAFTAGTFLSWTSPALPVLQTNSTDSPLKIPITENQGMWIGSLLAIGALVTAFPVGFLADRFGRKKILMYLSVPCILSWTIIIFGQKVEALYGARLLSGFSVGGICVVIPLYIGEIAEKTVRGALGSYFQLLLTLGILYSYVIGAYFDYFWLSIFCIIIPILFLLCVLIVPETPHFFVTRGKIAEAEKSLKWLRGRTYDAGPQIRKIEEEVAEAKRTKGTCKELCATKANKIAVFIACGLMFFQQMSGVNAVIFYAAQIFHFAGSNLDPAMCAIIVGSVQVVTTILAIFLVDRLGRKILLLLSSAIMSFCLFVFGVYFYLKANKPEVAAGFYWLPLVTVNIYMLCFSLGFGPLPWMMMGELFPSSIKGIAGGLAVTLNWLLVFIVTKTFQDLIDNLGTDGTFWLFGGITFVGIAFVVICIMETKGKTLGEIQKMLQGG